MFFAGNIAIQCCNINTEEIIQRWNQLSAPLMFVYPAFFRQTWKNDQLRMLGKCLEPFTPLNLIQIGGITRSVLDMRAKLYKS